MHSNYHLFTHLHFLASSDYNHGQALTQISFFLHKLLFLRQKDLYILHFILSCIASSVLFCLNNLGKVLNLRRPTNLVKAE